LKAGMIAVRYVPMDVLVIGPARRAVR